MWLNEEAKILSTRQYCEHVTNAEGINVLPLPFTVILFTNFDLFLEWYAKNRKFHDWRQV